MLDTHGTAATDLIDEGRHSTSRLSRALALLANELHCERNELQTQLSAALQRAATAELALMNQTKRAASDFDDNDVLFDRSLAG